MLAFAAYRHDRTRDQRQLSAFMMAPARNLVPAFLRYATLGDQRDVTTQGPGGTGKTVDAVSDSLRFEPKTGWAALPVQPPAGTWQLRAARVYPVLLTNFVLLAASALFAATTGYQYFMIGVLFWILLASWMGQCVFLFVVSIRGWQLERRERKLGYTTWARKK